MVEDVEGSPFVVQRVLVDNCVDLVHDSLLFTARLARGVIVLVSALSPRVCGGLTERACWARLPFYHEP